jgi:hypothetical protein
MAGPSRPILSCSDSAFVWRAAVSHISYLSLKGLGGEIVATELLPALQNLYFREYSTDECHQQSTDRFFAPPGHSVTLSDQCGGHD